MFTDRQPLVLFSRTRLIPSNDFSPFFIGFISLNSSGNPMQFRFTWLIPVLLILLMGFSWQPPSSSLPEFDTQTLVSLRNSDVMALEKSLAELRKTALRSDDPIRDTLLREQWINVRVHFRLLEEWLLLTDRKLFKRWNGPARASGRRGSVCTHLTTGRLTSTRTCAFRFRRTATSKRVAGTIRVDQDPGAAPETACDE